MSIADPTKYYRGQGILSIALRDSLGNPTGFTDMGNCAALMLRSSVDRIEHKEMRTGKQFTDASFERMVDGTLEMTLESIAATALQRYLYATTTQLAGATITNEIAVGYLGKKTKLARLNLTSFTSLTNAAATLTYSRDTIGATPNGISGAGGGYVGPAFSTALNFTTDVFTSVAHGLSVGQRVQLTGSLPAAYSLATNYFVIAGSFTADTFQLSATFGGTAVDAATTGSALVVQPFYDYSVNLNTGVLDIYPGANMTDATSLRATYVAGTSEKNAAFTIANPDLYLMFEGLNTIQNNAPVVVEVYKVRIDPADEWSLIGDQFEQFKVAGKIMYDTTKPDTTTDGRFWKETQLVSV